MANKTTTYQINMAAAFAAAFGVGQLPVRYTIPGEENNNPNVNYSGLPEITPEALQDKSWLGTPIHFKFGFKGGRYNAYNNGQIEQRELADFQMPLTTMVDFNRAKRITTTPTAGGNGTVKEIYGFNDWSIRIRGICINDPQHPQQPEARNQRKAIAAFEDLADAIELIEDDNVFTDLGIYSLVIKDVSFPQVPGKPHYLPFELRCLSDEPLELLI